MAKRRILIATPTIYPEPGGLQRYTHELASACVRLGHTVLVYSLSRPHGGTPLSYPVVRSNYLAEPPQKVIRFLGNHLHYADELAQLLDDFRPDVVFSSWWRPLGFILSKVLRDSTVPLLQCAHGQEVADFQNQPGMPSSLRKHYRLAGFERADSIVAVSHFTQELLIAGGIDPNKTRVVPNGLSPEYLDRAGQMDATSARSHLGWDRYTLLQVGRIVPRKGHASVITAIDHARDQLSGRFQYVVVGKGTEKAALEREVEARNLADLVHFAGYVPEEELHQYYAGADTVVMLSESPKQPTDVEGFGIVYLEAYAHRTPVIALTGSGATDAIRARETGILLQQSDPESVAQAILDMVDHPQQRHEMGLAGRTWVESTFNWDLLAEEMLAGLSSGERHATHKAVVRNVD